MNEAARTTVTGRYREVFEAARPSLRGAAAWRTAGFARFAELGFPGPREESWKYTNLRRLEGRAFRPAAREHARGLELELPAALGEHRLVLVNGYWRADLAGPSLPAGVRVRSLDDAHADETVAPLAMRIPTGGGTESFAALNVAMSADPLLIEVDAGVRCHQALHLLIIAAGAEAAMSHPRVVLRLGAGALARVVLHYRDDEAAERFVNSMIDVELAQEAELYAYRVQAHGSRTFHIERFDARLAAAARLAVRDAQLGSSLARLDLNVSLAGRAAETEITGLFIADGSRHLDTHVLVDHRAVATRSLQDYRGVAAGRGRAVFNGKAIVHPGAQQSNARQSSRNLLLTPGAEIDTKPELEIYADDVQCSHGATTGQLDPAALFYLRSRGLSETEARSALTRAFAAAVLSRIELPAVAELVRDMLDGRLAQLLEMPS